MVFRHRLYAVLAVLGVASMRLPLGALPPCGTPGTITTVTAPDGDHLAAFGDYRSYQPLGLALGPEGRVYVSDASLIYRLEADGTATRIVGVPQTLAEVTARPSVVQDSVAALEAQIAPQALAFDRQGRLYFVDYVNFAGVRWPTMSRIARLDADGQVVTFAGTGEFELDYVEGGGVRAIGSGDGGPAKEAQFGFISSLVFDREGHLLVAGTGGVRRIDGQGVVTTLVEADGAGALSMDGRGGLYFATAKQVFQWSAEGVIEHVAGSGVNPDSIGYEDSEDSWRRRYFGAEGRLATEAPFDYPVDIETDEQGTLYISNLSFHRIHRVRPDGIIETIAGNGLPWNSVRGCHAVEKAVVHASPKALKTLCFGGIGDGGPALEAPIWSPRSMLLTQAGDLLVVMSDALGGGFWGGEEFSQLRRICGVSERGAPTAVEAVEAQASASLAEEALPFLRLYPNPFNAAATIAFDLGHSASVAVRIYNELGQQVRVLAAEARRPAGSYQFVWDGRDETGQFQASGTYLLVLSVDGAIETHKLTLLH